ncbi:MAG: PTS glucose transporter subunit IIA [Longicatena sp.]
MELLYSPVNGEITNLENVNDKMFAEKMLGDGIALIPNEDEFVSPIDGKVTMIYDTQHAIGITTLEDTEILIHIGIDTVDLKGIPFDTKVKVGDNVKKGDLLTVIDWKYIKERGLDVIVPLIVMNKKVKQPHKEGKIRVGDKLLEIE